MAFQYPHEIPGVTNANFIRAALQARLPKGEELDAVAYYKALYAEMDAILRDEAPLAPLVFSSTVRLVHPSVRNWPNNLLDQRLRSRVRHGSIAMAR